MIRLFFKCWGCGKQEVHVCSSLKKINLTIAQMQVKGWRRTTLGPGANPWFCGDACATYSTNAIAAKKWWDRQATYNKYYHSKLGFIIMPLLVALVFGLNYYAFTLIK